MTAQPSRSGVPQLVPTLAHWPRPARERLEARIRAATEASRAAMPVPPPRTRRRPVTLDDAEFTAEQKLEGYRMYQRWKRGVGPRPSDEQIAWRTAYKRDAYARERVAAEEKRLAARAEKAAARPVAPGPSPFDDLLADPVFWDALVAQCRTYQVTASGPYAVVLADMADAAGRFLDLVKGDAP